jgi:SpoVK/Ycf46/Vps4 family AAA+-type ATPase
MAPILEESSPLLFSLGSLFDTEEETDRQENVSMWVQDKDIIRASTDLTILKKLESGVYCVNFDRENGLYCIAMKPVSDELFIFSDSITSKLMQEINLFWTKAPVYKENNLIHKRGILLEGCPGTGKSSIITLLSNEIISKGGVVFKVTGFRNLNYYVDFMRYQFRKLQPDTPVITILEDLDQYGDVAEELLDFLDGKTHLDHHVIIATSNNTEEIPDTFLRPSRIDLKIEIPLPSEETRREYFVFKKVPEADIEKLVELTDNLSLADLKEVYICIYLLDYSIEDAIEKTTKPREKKNYLQFNANGGSMAI